MSRKWKWIVGGVVAVIIVGIGIFAGLMLPRFYNPEKPLLVAQSAPQAESSPTHALVFPGGGSGFGNSETSENGPAAFVVATPEPSASKDNQSQNEEDDNFGFVKPKFELSDLGWMLAAGFWLIIWRGLAWLSWSWIFNALSKFFRNVHLDRLAEALDAPWQMVVSMTARDTPGPHVNAGVIVIEVTHLLLTFFVGNPFVWVILIPVGVALVLKGLSIAALALGVPIVSVLAFLWDKALPWLFHIVGPRLKGVEKRLSGEKDKKPTDLESAEANLRLAEIEARTILLQDAIAEREAAVLQGRPIASWALQVLRPLKQKPQPQQRQRP